MKFNQNIFLEISQITSNSLRALITLTTRNTPPLFPIKDKSDYKYCVIYKGDCSCGSYYIGKTKCNAEVRWNKQNNPTKSLGPSKHFQNNINYCHSK